MRGSVLVFALLACQDTVAPVSSAWLLRTWCPVDSLTTYAFNATGIRDRYVSGSGVSRYRLALAQDGTVTPSGAYIGRFTFDSLLGPFHLPGDTVDVGITPASPPGVVGHWVLLHGRVIFAWTYPDAGPTWFWELAYHPVEADHWTTTLNWEALGYSMYLRYTWEPC